ncbi:glycogen synthase GlgA [Planctomicrobium piriforme]|uniref:Glycogen synthase n=1 Tax=Planctomicrobium piriforme TaxID=1576369 RepID=A0A1I3BKA5_9PLAN|nr:glycogen synthase GlgA [Planctomicrobium piriforme]SFH62725.1 starch synthase [Planctomicrobium piriforme]
MHILMASSEAVPYAKTGGLADVATGLSKALAEAGHDVTLVLPLYRRFIPEQKRGEPVALMNIEMRQSTVKATVRRSLLSGTNVEVLLVDQPTFFDRRQLYTEGGQDYPDNAERFIFFSRAVMEIAQTLTRPHVIHVNDWQTSLVPALIKHERTLGGRFINTGTVLTIHNMAFHGQFAGWQMELTGLPKEYFNWQQMEHYGHLNLLKTGISMADMVTTVSPTYAREICRPEFGYGLDPLLVQRGDRLVGILNGVDTQEWNPAVDAHLPLSYSPATVADGKARCKESLQEDLGLYPRSEALLLGMISRLTDQKGLDLITARADEILQADVQMVFLGTGDRHFEDALKALQQRHPGRVSVRVGFDEKLAHRIEAGCDAYLMPSRFEPCGLNQQYSLLYGTLPIVHAVGGLADSVVNATPETIENQTANGFVFYDYNSESFVDAVWRAVGMFTHHRVEWEQLVQTGMLRDSTWRHSAGEYVKVYDRAIRLAAQPD